MSETKTVPGALRRIAAEIRSESHAGWGNELIDLAEILEAAPAPSEANISERVAVLTAHRACHSAEHDPLQGKLHGFCVVCGVPWPCEYAGKPPKQQSGHE